LERDRRANPGGDEVDEGGEDVGVSDNEESEGVGDDDDDDESEPSSACTRTSRSTSIASISPPRALATVVDDCCRPTPGILPGIIPYLRRYCGALEVI
jgi:hypothetical protein